MKRFFIRNIPSFLFIVLFVMLITACGSPTATSTATPTPVQPTATPTPVQPTPTPTPSLTVYKGSGYQVGYPQGWTAKNGSTSAPAQFTDAAHDGVTIAIVPNTTGSNSPTFVAQTTLALFKAGFTNYKDVSIPDQITANGLTWVQKAGTVNGPQAGQTAKIVILATLNTKDASKVATFTCLVPDVKTFDTFNTQVLQPMLQSFAFQG